MKHHVAAVLVTSVGLLGSTLTLAAPAHAVSVNCLPSDAATLNTCIANANAGANQEITIIISNDFVTDQDLTALDLPSTSTMIIDGNSKTISLGSRSGFDLRVSSGQTITINNLFTSGGQSSEQGGAIRLRNGRLSASNLKIQGATAPSYGGGIALNDDSVTHLISRSVISGNTSNANLGGGIFAAGAVTLTNSTIYGNTANSAGGLYVSGSSNAGVSSLQFSTITGNSAVSSGSNIAAFSTSTQLRLIGSVVSDPQGAAAQNCRSAVLSASYAVVGNTAGDDTSCGTATAGQIRLATTSAINLGTFSGTSLVPANTSVLVNAAPDALSTGITTDQVGTTRSGAFTVGSLQVALPAVSASPSSGSFGTVTTGTTSSATTFTITNSGSDALTFGAGAATISGVNSNDFAIASDSCSSATVPIASSCTVGVTFTPGAAGARSASLLLANDAADSPQSMALTGTGGSSGGGSGGGGSIEPAPTPSASPTMTPTATPAAAVTTVPMTRTVSSSVRFRRGTARMTSISEKRLLALVASVPASATRDLVRVVAVLSTIDATVAHESLARRRLASVNAVLRSAGITGVNDSVVRLPRGIYRGLAAQAAVTVTFTS